MSANLRPLILDVNNLSVEITAHGRTIRALDHVSLQVPRGRVTGLVGESGCGKSMTLRAILGLLPDRARVTAGHIRFNGVDLLRTSQRALNEVRGSSISMVFQDPAVALNPLVRIGDQIAEGPRRRLGYSKARAKKRSLDLMRLVGFPDPVGRYGAYPHELSGGMAQRVVIAIALSCEPELILCDEPTTALDVTIQDQILTLLSKLCDEIGVSFLFVTHDLAVVAELCQEVNVIYGGRVVETGQVAQVLHAPRHPYTLGLVQAVPDFDDARSHLVPIPGSPPDLTNPLPGCSFEPRCRFAEPDCIEGEFPFQVVDGRHRTACRHHRLMAPDPREGASA